jgi:hypothetical protein
MIKDSVTGNVPILWWSLYYRVVDMAQQGPNLIPDPEQVSHQGLGQRKY